METGALYAYLIALCQSPVTRRRIEEFGLPGEVRFASGSRAERAQSVYDLLKDAMTELNEHDGIVVKHYLFSRGKPGARHAAATRELQAADPEVSSSFSKNHLKTALTHYVEILHEKLQDFQPAALEAERPVALVPRWYDVIEMIWILRIDPEDYHRQHWERVLDIRSSTGDYPVITIPQQWTGKGYREGGVQVLSGQQRPEQHRHQCVRTRPEVDTPEAWELYVLDLGLSLLPGKREVLHYAWTLFDVEDAFNPYVWQRSGRHPALERLRFILDIPTSLGVDRVDAYIERPSAVAGDGFTPDASLSLARNEYGLFHHCFEKQDLDHESRYSMRWNASYRKS